MTTLPATGAANWTNFVDYWREEDAEWLQARVILRVAAPADLTALPTPSVGQVVYVKDVAAAQTDVLFLFASNGGGVGVAGWVPYPALPKYLYASEDTAARVTLGHHTGNPTSVVPAVTLSPTGVAIPADLAVRTDKFKVTATDVQIKTGTKNVVLTTDTAGLVSDSPIKAAGFVSTAAVNFGGQAVTAASVTATTLTATAAVNTVALAASGAVTAGSLVAASFTASGGVYTGDAGGAIVRGPAYVAGKAQVLVQADDIRLQDGDTLVDNQMKIYDGRSIMWYTGNETTLLGHSGPVIYSTGSPDPLLYPAGTIWVS